jgi:ABC-2 type transport system permease protein
VQTIAGLGAGVFVLWALTAVITVLCGLDSKVGIGVGPALYFAMALVATAVMFLAVGALTSQLGATRRQAASYAAAFLGIAYAVRMIADAGVGLHGLIWASPLGWVEELRPLTTPQPLALLPIVAFTAGLVAVAVLLAGRRDVGASIVADRDGRQPRMRLLSGPVGLAVRMVRPTVIGWWVGTAVLALLYGLVAKSAGTTITGSSIHRVFSKLGAPGTGADAVLGVCFLVLAVLVAFVGAGQLTAARSEESGGRIDHLLVRRVSRTSWLGGRLLVAVVVLLITGVGAGLFAWLGAATQHSGVRVATLVDAGVNLVPPAVAISGIGVLVFGLRPRLTSIVIYVLLGWSLLIVIVGGIGAVSHWVLDTSVFHQMASAPAVTPRWEANEIMTAIGVACALVGGFAFRRRDLQGE